jgi:putative DNA primase/helicase
MRSAAEILGDYGINLESTLPGRYYAVCPNCSHERKPPHQKLKCLGITIDDCGVKCGCNHCDWKGGGFYESRKVSSAGTKNGGSSPFVAQYIYKQADGTPYLKVCKTADKQFPQFHWNGAKWVKGKPKGPKIPYRLPELSVASLETVIYICEGEKDADNLAKIGLVATSASEGAGKWKAELNSWFKDRRIVVLPDADAPGREHGQKVARALQPVTASLKIIDLYRDRSDGSDVSDWLKTDSVGVKLIKAVNDAPLWEPNANAMRASSGGSDEEKIADLAKLSKFDYAKRRRDEAKKIGIPAKTLDAEVAKKRTEVEAECAAPPLYPHWTVKPWPKAVEGTVLLDALVKKTCRHVVMSEDQAVTAALWVILTWVHEAAAVHSPSLLVTSAEANSGKTTLIGIIGFLARNALVSVSITGPALFRSIEKWQPTFALDEADTAFVRNDDLRDVFNSGWTRGQGVIRCDPETNEPRMYSTFCPKAVAMKGRKLRDTTLSRCIIVELKRKLPTEKADDFEHIDDVELSDLRRQLARWANDNAAVLRNATPDIPPGFYNRVRANWKLMLAIAEAAGDDWKKRASQAAGAIEQVKEGFEPSFGVRSLRAMKAVLKKDIECLLSKDVIAALSEDPEQPWLEYNNGKPITQKQLARLLGQYGIKSCNVRPHVGPQGKGYRRTDFKEAWERYAGGAPGFPHSDPSQRPKADETGTSCDFSSVPENSLGRIENAELFNNDAGWDAGTDKTAGNGGARPSDQENHPPPPSSPDLDKDRTCAQCRGPVDGKEQLVAIGNAPPVWLHRDCEKFYLQARCLHCGNPADAHRGAVTKDRYGFTLHDGCRRDLQQNHRSMGGR